MQGGRATTLSVIKPHLVLDCAAGLLLDCVLESFDITAMELFKLDKTTSAEFYEVNNKKEYETEAMIIVKAMICWQVHVF